MPRTRRMPALVRRCTYEKHDGTIVLLHYVFNLRRGGRNTIGVIDKTRCPEFEGHQAWFEVERVYAKPWPYWQAITPLPDLPIPKSVFDG